MAKIAQIRDDGMVKAGAFLSAEQCQKIAQDQKLFDQGREKSYNDNKKAS